jgi:hypothetical protein
VVVIDGEVALQPEFRGELRAEFAGPRPVVGRPLHLPAGDAVVGTLPCEIDALIAGLVLAGSPL